jgi:hypothetical protein
MNIIFALNYNWELIFWLSIPCLFVLISLLLIIVHIKFKLDELKHGNDKTKVKQHRQVKIDNGKILTGKTGTDQNKEFPQLIDRIKILPGSHTSKQKLTLFNLDIDIRLLKKANTVPEALNVISLFKNDMERWTVEKDELWTLLEPLVMPAFCGTMSTGDLNNENIVSKCHETADTLEKVLNVIVDQLIELTQEKK